MKKYIQPTIKTRKASHARMICASQYGLNSSKSGNGDCVKDHDAFDEYNSYDNENLW